MTHPLIGAHLRFDSWSTLCEYVMEVAEEEAKKELRTQLIQRMSDMADEMIATAEEYEPETDN